MASSSAVEIDPDLLATLATKADLAPLATRDELHALRAELLAEIRQEGERTRRYFDIVAERVESSVSFIAEGHGSLDAKIAGVRGEPKADVADLDRRVTRLETRRRSR
jgi:uncharacterized protein YceH (UPF0502 family)